MQFQLAMMYAMIDALVETQRRIARAVLWGMVSTWILALGVIVSYVARAVTCS